MKFVLAYRGCGPDSFNPSEYPELPCESESLIWQESWPETGWLESMPKGLREDFLSYGLNHRNSPTENEVVRDFIKSVYTTEISATFELAYWSKLYGQITIMAPKEHAQHNVWKTLDGEVLTKLMIG